ncbi:hypothetical protein LX36DRAFT_58896 [Colletotrichum falcatum]|nr:hypothetical protein LX36DRAFT_58896 [Colletotrichum falcatum]
MGIQTGGNPQWHVIKPEHRGEGGLFLISPRPRDKPSLSLSLTVTLLSHPLLGFHKYSVSGLSRTLNVVLCPHSSTGTPASAYTSPQAIGRITKTQPPLRDRVSPFAKGRGNQPQPFHQKIPKIRTTKRTYSAPPALPCTGSFTDCFNSHLGPTR